MLSEVILHVIVHVGTGFGQLMKYDGVEIFLHVSMFCIIRPQWLYVHYFLWDLGWI